MKVNNNCINLLHKNKSNITDQFHFYQQSQRYLKEFYTINYMITLIAITC